MIRTVLVLAGALALGLVEESLAQSWSSAALLSHSPGMAGDFKEPQLYPASTGGFHACYRFHQQGGGNHVYYRRYQSGSLSPARFISNGTIFGGDLCQAGNGAIHVVWEDWNGALAVGWSMSSDGGQTWTSPAKITNFGDIGKIPLIEHFGASDGADVVMVCGRANTKDIWYNRFDGTTWAGFGSATSEKYESEYELFGLCRSLQDGTIYKSSDNSSNRLIYQRFDGYSWQSHTAVDESDFYPRMAIAVNPLGQVMVVWEADNDFWSRLYTPGVGWGAIVKIQDSAGFGDVVAVPGTHDFYAVYCKSVNRVRGKRFSGGAWQSEEIVSVDQSWSFTPWSRLCAGSDGSLYACWEYWGPNEAPPVLYYSILQAGPPQPMGTVAGIVRDNHGQPLSGAAITSSGANATVSGAGGTFTLPLPVGTYTLTASKAYYSDQVVTGVEILENQTTTQDFAIAALPPDAVQLFSVSKQENTRLQLYWHNPDTPNFSGTVIRYSTSGPPATVNDGALLIDQPNAPYSQESLWHNGLVNGETVYYTAFAYFDDASRHYASGVSASGTPALQADVDRDGDVDQDDFGSLQLCMTGDTVDQTNPACAWAKFDADDDVDHEDFEAFQQCFSGPGSYADPACE